MYNINDPGALSRLLLLQEWILNWLYPSLSVPQIQWPSKQFANDGQSGRTWKEKITIIKEVPISEPRFDELKVLIDSEEHIQSFIDKKKIFRKMSEMIDFYKYRRFVPIFARSEDNTRITRTLHVYYYDRLKIYYNEIKKQLNISISLTEQTSSSN